MYMPKLLRGIICVVATTAPPKDTCKHLKPSGNQNRAASCWVQIPTVLSLSCQPHPEKSKKHHLLTQRRISMEYTV